MIKKVKTEINQCLTCKKLFNKNKLVTIYKAILSNNQTKKSKMYKCLNCWKEQMLLNRIFEEAQKESDFGLQEYAKTEGK